MRADRVQRLGIIAVAAAVACGPGADDLGHRKLDVLAADTAERSPAALLAQKQRDFLRALAVTSADPSPFMSTRFAMTDYAQGAAAAKRGVDGRPVLGGDYVRTLAQRLSPDHAEIGTLEVLLDRPGTATVLVRHPNALATVTHWSLSAGEWKVIWLRVNVEEDLIQRMRARRAAGP